MVREAKDVEPALRQALRVVRQEGRCAVIDVWLPHHQSFENAARGCAARRFGPDGAAEGRCFRMFCDWVKSPAERRTRSTLSADSDQNEPSLSKAFARRPNWRAGSAGVFRSDGLPMILTMPQLFRRTGRAVAGLERKKNI